MLKFKVHSNLSLEAVKKLEMASTRAETAVAQQILKDTSPFVPALTGSFDQRAHTEGGEVIYPGPYARFLYYGKLLIDPKTGSSWAPQGGTKEVTGKDLQYSKVPHGKAQDHWFEASKALNLQKWTRAAGRAVKRELDK